MTVHTPILGIDPGYDRLGWAIATPVKGVWKDIHFGCIKTSSDLPLFDRYQRIHQELTSIIQEYKPTLGAIESLFFFKNQKTALHVSEARGVILTACFLEKIKMYEFTPLQIKQAVTGYGKADKKSVEKMVRLQLNLEKENIIDDAIDALAVMITYQAQRALLDR